jgi:hypothetical protein
MGAKRLVFFILLQLLLLQSIFSQNMILSINQKGESEEQSMLAEGPSPTFKNSADYVPSNRIVIDSNNDFSTYASSGDGSIGDPWLISGLSIS